jgi:hypothetical protein
VGAAENRTKSVGQRLAVVLGLILIAAVTMGGAIYLTWFSPLNVDQRISASTAALTGGAFLLAMAAGAIAYAAYRYSIRRPDLHFDAQLEWSAGTTTLKPRLVNWGDAAARNTAIRLYFLYQAQLHYFAGWTMDYDNPTSCRWESTADVTIHAQGWEIPLPPISFVSPGEKSLTMGYWVVADGFSENGDVIFETEGDAGQTSAIPTPLLGLGRVRLILLRLRLQLQRLRRRGLG